MIKKLLEAHEKSEERLQALEKKLKAWPSAEQSRQKSACIQVQEEQDPILVSCNKVLLHCRVAYKWDPVCENFYIAFIFVTISSV